MLCKTSFLLAMTALALAGNSIPAWADEGCNDTPGCGGAASCGEPGATCGTGDCDSTTPSNAKWYECGADGKWWPAYSESTVVGTLCGNEDEQLYHHYEYYVAGTNIKSHERTDTRMEAAAKTVSCAGKCPTVTVFPCVILHNWDETWSYDDAANPPTYWSTRWIWQRQWVVETGCPGPTRDAPAQVGCTLNGHPCAESLTITGLAPPAERERFGGNAACRGGGDPAAVQSVSAQTD